MPNETPIAATQWWPNNSIRIVEKSKGDFRATVDDARSMKIEYFPENFGLLHTQGEQAEPIGFDPRRVKSIELQNREDFAGMSGKGFRVTILRNATNGGRHFAKTLGLTHSEIDMQTQFFEVLFIAMIAGALTLILGGAAHIGLFEAITWLGGGPVTEYNYHAQTMTWWFEHGWTRDSLAPYFWSYFFIGSAVITGLFGLLIVLGTKLLPEPNASIFFMPNAEYYVVFYMVDGKRVIVATAYRDRSKAIEMHTDHLNAWQAAKLDQAAAPLKNEESEYL